MDKITKASLYNDDCISLLKSLPKDSYDCVITDPPYFVLPKGKKQ